MLHGKSDRHWRVFFSSRHVHKNVLFLIEKEKYIRKKRRRTNQYNAEEAIAAFCLIQDYDNETEREKQTTVRKGGFFS